MRAAVYARFSSENQREQSIEDQVRVCRTFAVREEKCEQCGLYPPQRVQGCCRLAAVTAASPI
jgi:hypothetical protein